MQDVAETSSVDLAECLNEMRNQRKGPFTNDVSREGEGGGYPNTDAVKEVAWF